MPIPSALIISDHPAFSSRLQGELAQMGIPTLAPTGVPDNPQALIEALKRTNIFIFHAMPEHFQRNAERAIGNMTRANRGAQVIVVVENASALQMEQYKSRIHSLGTQFHCIDSNDDPAGKILTLATHGQEL